MSSNSFQISGSALALLPSSGWSSDTTNSGGTLTNLTGINFLFETFSNYPKLVRLTIKGNFDLTTTAAGHMNYNCYFQHANLPKWAWPASVPGVTASNTEGSTAFNINDFASPVILTIGDDGSQSFIGLKTTPYGALGPLSVPFSASILYLAA